MMENGRQPTIRATIESYAGAYVDFTRHLRNTFEARSFAPRKSRLRWVYGNYFVPEATTRKDESWAITETMAEFEGEAIRLEGVSGVISRPAIRHHPLGRPKHRHAIGGDQEGARSPRSMMIILTPYPGILYTLPRWSFHQSEGGPCDAGLQAGSQGLKGRAGNKLYITNGRAF